MDELERELAALVERATRYLPEGFSVDLSAEPEEWDRLLRALGHGRGYALMAEALCKGYEARYGEPFLFTEDCVAWELQYHAEAYFNAIGYAGYRPHFSTLFFNRERLIRHTKVIDVSAKDAKDPKQALTFGYRAGVRPCWRGTEKDPYRNN